MAYNFQIKRVASEAREQLPAEVTNAKRTAQPSEFPQIERAGQSVYDVLEGLDDDSLVEIQCHGSDTPSQDARTYYVSMTASAIRTREAAPVKIEPWVPAQLRRPTEDTAT